MTISSQLWQIPPQLEYVRLADDEVHVWRAFLDVPKGVVQHLQEHLLWEEVAKANRFYFVRDRNRFIVARGILRTLLGHYLGVKPTQPRFCYNAYGKPELDIPSYGNILRFNIAHSHGFALFAFTYKRHIGVDMEFMNTNIPYDELAKHSFSLNENAVFQALPSETKRQAFFNCWTRKEAYIKARGVGLYLDLALFDVSMKPGEPVALLQCREDRPEVVHWKFQELAVGPDFASALVVEGDKWTLCTWQWQ